MIRFEQLPTEERALYLREAAVRLNMPPVIVEKNYWVCWTLRELFSLGEFLGELGEFRGQYIELFGILFRSWLLWPESPLKQDLDIINKCLLTKWSARPLMFAERGHFILG